VRARENLGELLGESQLAEFLEAIEEDYGRFEDITSVVGELAEHVFRGRVQVVPYHPFAAAEVVRTFELTYEEERRIRIEGLMDAVVTRFVLYCLYSKPLRGGIVEYESEISIRKYALVGREEDLRLLDLLFEELAGMLGHPDIGRLVGRPYGGVTLYRNIRLFGED
jgi:hypothetical protein